MTLKGLTWVLTFNTCIFGSPDHCKLWELWLYGLFGNWFINSNSKNSFQTIKIFYSKFFYEFQLVFHIWLDIENWLPGRIKLSTFELPDWHSPNEILEHTEVNRLCNKQAVSNLYFMCNCLEHGEDQWNFNQNFMITLHWNWHCGVNNWSDVRWYQL